MQPRVSAFGLRPGWWLISTFSVCVALLLMAFAAPEQVGPGSALNLLDLQVFAKRYIRAASSDYQGPTVAGSDIELTDFAIIGDLTSGGHITFRRGNVAGIVRAAAKPDLLQVNTKGQVFNSAIQVDLASRMLDRLGARLANLPITTEARIEQTNDAQAIVRNVDIAANRSMDVVELKADQITSAWPTQTRIRIRGDDTARLVVRILGSDIHLRNVDFSISGGIDPADVVFLFPQAYALEIADSGGALDVSGASIGIPGSIVAPNAIFRFASALITGQVFVRDVLPISGSPSGQIDTLKPPGDRTLVSFGGITPNRILQQIGADMSAWDCGTANR